MLLFRIDLKRKRATGGWQPELFLSLLLRLRSRFGGLFAIIRLQGKDCGLQKGMTRRKGLKLDSNKGI